MILFMNLQGKYNSKKFFPSQIHKKYQNKYQNIATKEIIFLNQYSVKSDNLKFTNFLQRVSSDRNVKLKKHIDNCKLNPSYFDMNFTGRDVSQQSASDLKKIKRVNGILNLYKNVPQQTDILYKATLVNSNERGFQLYFTMCGNVKYVYIIDIYHLLITSKLDRKKQHFSLINEYNMRKKYNKDIKDVLFI